MTELTVALIALAVSGLGFITYKHPPIARKLLVPLLYLSIGTFLFILVYSIIKISAYDEAYKATRIDISIDIDEMFKNDTINSSIDSKHGYDYQHEKYFAIYNSKILLSESITKNINSLIEDNRKNTKTYLLYCFYSFLIIIILFGLTFLFDNIQDKEKV